MIPIQRSISCFAMFLGFILALAGDARSLFAEQPASATTAREPAALRSRGGGVAARPRFACYFTAPADAPSPGRGSRDSRPSGPVRSYEFLQIDERGGSNPLAGYADSVGRERLVPQRPGACETAWLELTPSDHAQTIVVLSRGWSGHPSGLSNGVTIAAILQASATEALARASRAAPPRPRVPAVQASAGEGASH